MIRLDGALGVQMAIAEARHDQPVWRLGRIVGSAVVLAGLGYWLAFTVGLTAFQSQLLGLAEVTVGFGILVGMLELYYHVHTQNLLPRVPLAEQTASQDWLSRINLADYASWELGRVLLAAQAAPSQTPSGHQTSFDLGRFFQALLNERTTTILLARAGLVGTLGSDGEEATTTPAVPEPVETVEALLAYAAVKAVETSHRRIHLSHVLLVLPDHNQGFAGLLFRHKVEVEDLREAVEWFQRARQARRHRFFWERGKVGIWGIGRDWAAGYTPTLSQYAVDLSRYLSDVQLQTQIIGRQQAIDQIEQVLASERRANVLLVGLPSVGKKTIVNGLAARIASGDAVRSLADKHILELDVGHLLAGVAREGQLEERLLRVLRDAERAGNIILFVNHIQSLLAAEAGKIGSINAVDILLPFLRSGRIQLIGSTTPADYHAVIAPQGAISGAFTRIDIDEPSPEDSVVLAEDVALHLEARHEVFIPVPVIRQAVTLGKRYIQKSPLPESAFRLLEAAAVRQSNQREHLVTIDTINDVVTQVTKVPVGDVAASEKDKLLRLEAILHERVIGQDEAVTAIASAMRRARSGLTSSKRPLGSFLFLGPTGVGKTETAKALAEAYFGADNQMIRLDMSEFQSQAGLARLIGAPTEAQAASSGQLASAVRDRPFSLVLLDEIEKAHPDVLNIFLQVLDEGRVSDGRGEPVDFTNAIIIATSNAGSVFIAERVKAGQRPEQFREPLLDLLQQEGQFRPEFLNRFDAVIAFQPLSQAQLLKIVDLQLRSLNERLAAKDVQVQLTDTAKARLAELGYQPEFGARALRRVIQDRVENLVAERLLAGTVERGQTVKLDVGDLGGKEQGVNPPAGRAGSEG